MTALQVQPVSPGLRTAIRIGEYKDDHFYREANVIASNS